MNEPVEQNLGIASALIESIRSPEVSDLVQDYGEIALDSLMTGGLLKEVPVIKTILALSKTANSIRERIFIKKIAGFLTEFSSMSQEEREELDRKITEDPKFKQRVGETLVVILDRLDSFEKAQLLARLFRGYLRNELDYVEFQRLASAIDRAFIQDIWQVLDYFARTPKAQAKGTWTSMATLWERLYLSGLSKLTVAVDVERQIAATASGAPPVTEQKVSYSHSADADKLARVLLGDRYQLGVRW